MPCVHYKFPSKLTHDMVPFEGLHITLRELKRQIMRRERLKLCDLQISSAQTCEEYTDDEALISSNTSVIIRRIPAAGLKPTNKGFVNVRAKPSSGSSKTQQIQRSNSSPVSLEQLLKTENLAEENASEEDKIKAVMYQSSLCYYSSSDAMKLLGLLPPNYVCFRCGIPGHHIKNCPTNGGERFAPGKPVRKCSGIPRSFLLEVEDPDRKGVMMDRSGKYVIPIMDAEAYTVGKKEKPLFPDQPSSSSSSSEDPVPDVLLCLICKDLLTDAVTIPCCRSSCCDQCIRTCLLESDGHVCPTCGHSDVSPDALTANTTLRREVNHFRNATRSLHSYQSPNHSRPSGSPVQASSSKRGKRSRSRSPLDQNIEQKRPRYRDRDLQSCIGETSSSLTRFTLYFLRNTEK